MAKKINMNEKEFLNYMRTRCNSIGESLWKRTYVIRQIQCFPKNSNQNRRAFVLYNNLGYILDVIESIAFNRLELNADLTNRITAIEDDTYMNVKDFKHYLEYSLDW